MKLRDLAHARTGDKGDVSNITVIVFDTTRYDEVRRALEPERVHAWFAGFGTSRVERYELPALGALNFVLHDTLAGGVTRSLALDAHGKCLSSHLLAIELDI